MAYFLKKIGCALWSIVLFVFKILFGQFNWTPPFWLRKIYALLKKLYSFALHHVKTSIISLCILIVLICAGAFGWNWYQSLPTPQTVAYTTITPNFTDYTKKPYIGKKLEIRFVSSVAPIKLVGKDVAEGISLKPDIEGKWVWSDDQTLSFLPNGDWPIDQAYNINFDKKKLFRSGILLKEYNNHFKTKAFDYLISESKLYEDPTAPQQKKKITTIRATHPIDQSDFAEHISVTLSKGLKYLDGKPNNQPQIFFSDDGLNAYIHTGFLALPEEESKVTITIGKGIHSVFGGNKTQTISSSTSNVPGRYQLSFNSAQIQFVDNNKGEPDPVFMFTSSMAVSDPVIEKSVDAWELPLKQTEDGASQEYWDDNEITEALLKKSRPITLTHIPSDTLQNTLHAFKFSATPNRQLYIRIHAKIEATGGYLSRDAQTLYLSKMPSYPKTLSFMSNGALLSLNGERSVGITGRGIKGAQVEIARILPGQLNHFVRRLDDEFQRPEMSDSEFSELVERFQTDIPFNPSAPNETLYGNVDLSPYLNANGGRKGIFVLRINEQGRYDEDTLGDIENIRDYRFIVVTDLGIIAKKDEQGGQDIFVQSISTGYPIENALVEVYGLNGLPVAQAYSDATGHVHFDYLGELQREKQPLMYVVTNGDDQSFLPIASQSRQLDFSRFDIGGLSNEGDNTTLRAFLFSERGLYRPGETVHLGMIVRQDDWQGSLVGMPVVLEIIDPLGRTLQTQNMTLNEAAFLSFDFASNPNAPAGTYSAQLSLPKDIRKDQRRFLGSVSFSIRDFEPDRMKVTASLSNNEVIGWIKPENVKASVQAMHLFGAPASDRRVALTMSVEPAFPGFSAYRDYSFYAARELQQSFYDELADKQTDQNGEADFDLNLKRFDADLYNLNIMTRVFESGSGRNVASDANVLVSNQDYMIGIKAQGSLDYIQKDAAQFIDIIAIDPQLKKIAVEDLTSELIEKRYVSVLIQKEDKTYAYESRRKDVLVETKSFNLSDKGLQEKLKTDEPGSFILKIKKGNTLLNQQEYYVAGNANTSRSLDRNAELQIKLDKNSYAPGDIIAVSMNAPYVGAGLITIERDKVYAHEWFKSETTSSVQYIQLPEGIEGNAYINVQFVRSPSSDEIFMSPLSYAVKSFSVNLDQRRIKVGLNTPKVVEPGDELSIKVSLDKPTDIIVWGVDEGILQVARYEQPLPLEYFFRKRALGVETSQILDMILPEFSQLLEAAATGGDGDDSLASHLNPFKRKAKPPVVYWSGLKTLPAGQSELKWMVPDYFNGKVHFYAVAVKPNYIGATQTYTDSRAPIVLTPNVPPFVAPGDTVVLTTGAFSNLEKTGLVKVSLVPDAGWTMENAEPISLTIDPKTEKNATFKLVAGDILGSHDLKFIAEYDDGKTIETVETISIRPASERRVKIDTVLMTEKDKQIPVERKLFEQKRDVSAGASYSPIVWSDGLNKYLDNYQYICSEQTISKGYSAIILGHSGDLNSIDKVKQTMTILEQRINGSGGLGSWSATPDTDIFATLYAMEFIIDAKERGFTIPNSFNQSIQSYVLKIAREKPKDGLEGARLQAQAIYLLTKQGVVVSNELSSLREKLETYFEKDEWSSTLIGAYMAASYKAMKQNKEADALYSQQNWSLLLDRWYSPYYYDDPLIHDAILLEITARYFPDKLNSISNDVLLRMGNALRGQYYNSLSASLLIRSFALYENAANESGLIKISAILAKDTKTELQMTGTPPSVQVPLNTTAIQFQKSAAEPAAFVILTETGYDRTPADKAITNGIEIFHEYVDEKGKTLSQVKVGDEFFVRVSIRASGDKTISPAAIVDLLPGGTEIVYRQPNLNVNDDDSDDYGDGNVSSEQEAPVGEASMSTWQPNFVDPRDDRVVLYGYIDYSVQTFTYRVRAINEGVYTTPPAFGESMYEPNINGQSIAGKITILPADEGTAKGVNTSE